MILYVVFLRSKTINSPPKGESLKPPSAGALPPHPWLRLALSPPRGLAAPRFRTRSGSPCCLFTQCLWF